MKTITVPAADVLMRRLAATDDEPHQLLNFYPRLLEVAGRECVGASIALHLVMAASDYTKGQPPFMFTVVTMGLWRFVPAFTDDPQVQADALDHLKASGLPDGRD